MWGKRPELAQIDSELLELGRCNRLEPISRQRLLQIIHASRSIDTFLSTLLVANGIAPKSGIGGKLHQLKSLNPNTKGYLTHSAATAFETDIARKRNLYAHSAGTFPTSTNEVDRFVAAVHSCLALII
jgi:hypothetical protein